ncbi:MAG: enoyl-CoA hydratase/isomerase family protein, partial [Gemmatimonadales bacterium]|nr:enoyl-CoA hydratase/isomerase family protein [Gemmatimonadales bacterium]
LTERQGGIGIITISRPDKRNALDAPTHDQLLAAFEAMKRDEAVRVVVLTGAGKAFVSGSDVREFVERSPVEMLGRLLQQPSAIEVADGFPKPLIAMINGYCLGTGNELAMACDIRIASEDAKFGQPEINLGMIPGGGATQRLPRLVGLGQALWMMYTGAILDSSDALRMGLVDLVVPPEQLRPRTMTLAQMIASKSAVALAMIKEAARASVRAPLDDGIRHEQSLASVVFSSKDMQEGLKAFLEKRQPRFTGE